jgi:DNA-binding transcriptional ArsR family regulator
LQPPWPSFSISPPGFGRPRAWARALSDPTRLTLAAPLGRITELCVCDLAWVSERAENLVSHHLRVLRAAGLVSSRRDGKMVMYSLTGPAVRCCVPCWMARLCRHEQSGPTARATGAHPGAATVRRALPPAGRAGPATVVGDPRLHGARGRGRLPRGCVRRAVGSLRIGRRLPHELDALRFNPRNTGGGMEPAGWLNGAHDRAYMLSQRAGRRTRRDGAALQDSADRELERLKLTASS